MNNLCFVCYAELSPEAEACFSCGAVRGVRVTRAVPLTDVRGITIAGEERKDAQLRPEALPPGITFSLRFTIQDELPHTPLWFRYRAVDLERGIEVELRTLREGDSDSQGWQAMNYMQRYQGHPNLLGFMHVDLEAQPPFAVSDIQQGIQLSHFLKGHGGRIALSQSLSLIQELLVGLSALHEEGYAHADIHPDSVWLDAQGRLRLDGGGPFGRTTVSIYASPEQMNGEMLTPRSDMYTIGLLWYRILTGELPFHSLNEADIQGYSTQKQKNLAPLSPRLAMVVRGMLVSDPQKRPKNAQALLRDLRDIFRNGWFNLPELSRAELLKRASSSRFILHGSVVATNDSLRLLKSGAATGTAQLIGGKVLLRTSVPALSEAGLQELLPAALKADHPAARLMLDCMVHDEPDVLDRLKKQPARTILEQVEIAQLAWHLGYSELARARIGVAIKAVSTAKEWCHISETLTHLGDSKAAKEALQHALEMSKTLEEYLQVAALIRWNHNDQGATKRALGAGARLVEDTESALRFAAGWLALLSDVKSAQVILDTVLDLSEADSILQQCDHLQSAISIFGLADIWIAWLLKIQKGVSHPSEWERIVWLWQHLQQPQQAKKAQEEGRRMLDMWRQKIEIENRRLCLQIAIPELSLAAVEAFEKESLIARAEQEARQAVEEVEEEKNEPVEEQEEPIEALEEELQAEEKGSVVLEEPPSMEEESSASDLEEPASYDVSKKQKTEVSAPPQMAPIFWIRLVIGMVVLVLALWLLN